jgi:ribonuclease-3
VLDNIFKKIRLFRHPKKESYFALYKVLGFLPKNIRLYEEALSHKSLSGKYADNRYPNNERLEFLGDAIMNSIIAEILFKKFPNRNEGFLTNTRSKIVQREAMDKIATQLGLPPLIVFSPHIQKHKNHILGNALEAFIGAIYLDQGYRKTRHFIEEKILNPHIDMDALVKKEVNFKSKLLEWTQKYHVSIEFVLIENYTDKEFNPVFQSHVLLNGLLAGVGTGYSKKESHQRAAQMALKKVKDDKAFVGRVMEQNQDQKIH